MNVAIIKTSNAENLNKIVSLCYITLEDMGVSVIEVDLNKNEDVIHAIKNVDGIIISTDMRMNNIPSRLQAFFELFEDENKDILRQMPVMSIIISNEYNTLDGYKIILANLMSLECIETGRIMNYTSNTKKSYIEAQVKSLYDYIKNNNRELSNTIKEVKKVGVKDKVINTTIKRPPEKKEDDIMELTELFSRQLSQKIGKDVTSEIHREKAMFVNEITVKQMTKNLEHYFQPQLTSDINSIYQINVIGDEEFVCNVTIKNKEFIYKEGEKENMDVIINVDSGIWKLILLGSISAQKAFMTGKIKVKGDFMLLAKFDKIFKKM